MAEESYSTIDKIVRECLIAIGEDIIDDRYGRMLKFGGDFLDEFNVDSGREVKTVELEICNDRDVKLPCDFVDYVKAGILIGNKIRILRHNSDIPGLPVCTNENPRPLYSFVGEQEPVHIFTNYGGEDAVNGYGAFPLYGYGDGGYEHSFRLLRNEKVIRLSSEVSTGSKFYLEYISNLHGPGSPVNPLAKKACEYYILWQYYFSTRKDSIYKQYENYYYNELKKVRARMQPWSLRDHYALISENYGHY